MNSLVPVVAACGAWSLLNATPQRWRGRLAALGAGVWSLSLAAFLSYYLLHYPVQLSRFHVPWVTPRTWLTTLAEVRDARRPGELVVTGLVPVPYNFWLFTELPTPAKILAHREALRGDPDTYSPWEAPTKNYQVLGYRHLLNDVPAPSLWVLRRRDLPHARALGQPVEFSFHSSAAGSELRVQGTVAVLGPDLLAVRSTPP